MFLRRAARSVLGSLGVLGIAASLATVPARAQTPTGEISGVVVDPSGSAVPGVTITLTSAATNAVREVQTNSAGLYIIPAIPPGRYTLKAQISGFRAIERRDIDVQVGSSNRIPITLELGDLTETVEIRGGAPLVQSSNASIGTVIENRSIVELPLNGRNYLQLASLIPGATTNGPSSSQGRQRMGGQRNSFALNVAGQRIHYNHYSLDGIENTDLNFNSYMLLPSVDALQEFKVEAGSLRRRVRARHRPDQRLDQIGIESVSRHGVRVRAQFLARRQELLRPRRSPDSAVQAQPVRAHGRRAGGHTQSSSTARTGCSFSSTGRACASTSRSPRRPRCR